MIKIALRLAGGTWWVSSHHGQGDRVQPEPSRPVRFPLVYVSVAFFGFKVCDFLLSDFIAVLVDSSLLAVTL